jgi:hypothetical protein
MRSVNFDFGNYYKEIEGEEDLKISNFELRPSNLQLIRRFPMLTYKNTGIQKYILDRICEIDDEIVNEDPEYQKPGELVDEWKKQLAAKLPPEDEKMLGDYEGSWVAQLCRQEEIIFNEALMEGIMFGYWVAMVNRGGEKIVV